MQYDTTRQHRSTTDQDPVPTRLARQSEGATGMTAQMRLAATLDGSPAMVAQRRLAATLSHRPLQRAEMPEDDDDPLQAKSAQRPAPVQRQQTDRTGLPDHLRAGMENLSGLAMNDVRVHYNSPEPRQLQALAFAQGSDIHVAPGQERHLPHEAWHVVQQRQGRVQPTLQAMGVAINDDEALESEADRMGAKAVQMMRDGELGPASGTNRSSAIQRRIYQRVSAGSVTQLIYLWDRSAEDADDAPHWVEEADPPQGYLISGRYNDGEHGDDAVYSRLGETDLFYGLNYDGEDHEEVMQGFLDAIMQTAQANEINVEEGNGFADAIRLYEAAGNVPLIYVDMMKALYSGSSGWDRYSAYLPEQEQGELGPALQVLNPDLPWANPVQDRAGYACQVAMIEAIRQGGSVRFLVDGMEDIRGIVARTSEWSGNVTSHELRFALGLLDQQITIGENETLTPQDGVNVFFYLNRQLVPAATVADMD